MEVPFDFVNEFINQNLLLPERKGSNEFLARCPLCMDSKKSATRKRFNLIYKSPETILYHCFNCGRSGDFIGLYGLLKGVSYNTAKVQIRKLTRGNSLDSLKFRKREKKKEVVVEKVENFNYILEDCIDKEPVGHVQEKLYKLYEKFIEDRKIGYSVYCCYRGRYKGRVIIPIYDGDDIVYFQARTLVGNERKYLNPISEKKQIIYNLDKLDFEKDVIVVEGLIDALSIGNATTILGAAMDEDFLKVLLDKGGKIIVCLDNDEAGMRSMLSVINENKYASKLRYCIFPSSVREKDLNELLCNGYDVDGFVLDNCYDRFKAELLLKSRGIRYEKKKKWISK